MGYLVITGVDKPSSRFHAVLIEPTAYTVSRDYGFVDEATIVQFLSNNPTVATLNFSVDRSGKVVQNCGDFSRFSKLGSAVVLAELKSKSGRTLGYRLLSCANNACVNLKLPDILAKEKMYSSSGEHFLQNGIVRNNTVNCYPMKPFNIITVELGTKASKKPVAPKRPEETAAKKPVKAKPQPNEFSKEQMQELQKCKEKGINPQFIYNPQLSPQQMRVLWVAKSKGCMSESFSDPQFSVDAMKFYADRLYDQQTVADCGEMLAHPELEPDQLSELYACVCQGVPYSGYIGMSATDINVAREMQVSKYWGSSSAFDGEPNYLEKAVNVAMRMKGSM